MRSSSRRLLALGFGLMMASSAAQAQQPGTMADFRDKFIRLDANGDTVLERDEIPEAGRDAFDRLLKRGDENANGKLEPEELRALGQKVQAVAAQARPGDGSRLKAMDRNGDGQVSREEFTGPARLFNRLDTDKNGAITIEEARAAAPAAKPQATNPPRARLKALDKDGDGKISRAEFPRPAAFDRLDANNDGFLSPDELPRPAGATPKAL